MVEIVWKEPPPAVGGETGPILAALKANPGKWAQVKTGMKSGTGYTTWKKLGCTAVARRDDAGLLWDVYACWPDNAATRAAAAAAAAHARPATPAAAIKPAPAAHTPDPGLNKFLDNRRNRGNQPDGTTRDVI